MEADFDAKDKSSWFFGTLSRKEANDILSGQQDNGVFLVRESKTSPGDYVLCVNEVSKISHYIISKIPTPDGMSKLKIGEKEFPDLPSLLNYYKTHYLDKWILVRPAPRENLNNPQNVLFKTGDTSESDNQCRSVSKSNDEMGQIPGTADPHLPNPGFQSQPESCTATDSILPEDQTADPHLPNPGFQSQPESCTATDSILPEDQVQLPAKAIVILQKVPSVYVVDQLKLEVNDIVTVHKMNVDGQWEGSITEKNGDIRKGKFPFTHIRFLTQEELKNLPS